MSRRDSENGACARESDGDHAMRSVATDIEEEHSDDAGKPQRS
jgi:hypothetical protein